MLQDFLKEKQKELTIPVPNEFVLAMDTIQYITLALSAGLNENYNIEEIVKKYLHLFVNSYGYEGTLNFVKSRSQWEKSEGDVRLNMLQMIKNLTVYATNIQTGKNTADLSLKPVFFVFNTIKQ